MYSLFLKPVFDFAFALIVLILVSPIMLLVILLLAIVNRGSIWFIQERPGKEERIFKVIKFKTMNDQRTTSGSLLPDDKRLTPLGKLIRKTSVDELPQLFNVLKGEMSIVGPRPLLKEYLLLYNEQQRMRHSVRPGITGWAQVNGRNTLNWKERFDHDIWYVKHQSFLFDLKILLLTVAKVLKSEGISSNTSATMEPFSGNEEK